jgi:hypothetical protein
VTDENRTPIPIDEPHLPLDDTITKRVLEAMRPTRITDPEAVASELKRTIESVAALSPGESYVRNAEKAANSFHSSMVEDMRRAAEEVRKASLGVDYSLALVPQFNSSRNHTGFPSDVLSSMRPVPSADQVTETNNR